jgi:chromosome partitioning protein
MYDARLRLSNQVVDEVTKHFQQMVFKTIIQRNIKLSESPSFGKPVILYDASSTGSINYLNLAKELLQNNDKTISKNAQKAAI